MTDNERLTNGTDSPLKVTHCWEWYSQSQQNNSIVPVTFFAWRSCAADFGYIAAYIREPSMQTWVSLFIDYCFVCSFVASCAANLISENYYWTEFTLFAGLDFIEGQGEDFERALESTGEFIFELWILRLFSYQCRVIKE